MTLDATIYGLHRFGPEDVRAEPFPHLLVPGRGMPAAEYGELRDHFPALELFVAGRRLPDNHKIHCSSERMRRGDGVASCWSALAEGAAGDADVVHELVRIFGPHVEREYPDLFRRFRAGDVAVGRRGDARADLHVEPMATVHTPVRGAPRHQRGPHVKECPKLFVCAVYMPCEPAAADGGDIWICRRRKSATSPFGKAQTLPVEEVAAEAVLPYAPNSMLVFMNTPRSIVYETPRPPSREPYRYTHLIVEARQPLFDLPRQRGHDALWRRVGRKVRGTWRRRLGTDPGFMP